MPLEISCALHYLTKRGNTKITFWILVCDIAIFVLKRDVKLQLTD